MSKFVFVQRKRKTPIRRRIDNAAGTSWTNALDSFDEGPHKHWRDPTDGPAPKRSPPSPQFSIAKKSRRLVLCESDVGNKQPELDPDLSGSPTFSGQGPRIIDCEESPLSRSPIFGPKWDISPGSPTTDEPARPSSPVISSFGSSASSAASRLVCVTPERSARPPPSRQRAPDSGKKAQQKLVKGGQAERTARLRKRWKSEAAIWLHKFREKSTKDTEHLLLRIHSCSCSFSLLAVSCSVLSGTALAGQRQVRVLMSPVQPHLDPRDFHTGAALRIFPPWELSHFERGALLWNVTNFLIER